MSKLRLRFQINNLKKNDSRLAKVALTRAGVDQIKEVAAQVGEDVVYDRINAARSDIKATVENDLASYTEKALLFFLNQQSPNTSQVGSGRAMFSQRRITFRDTGNYNTTFTSSKARVNTVANSNPQVTVVWDSLAPSTIKKKRKKGTDALRFYYDTGRLSRILTQKLGRAFKDILKFDIQAKRSKELKRKVIRVQAIPTQQLNRAGLAGLGNFDDAVQSTGNNKQILNFLKIGQSGASERLLEKLSNTGRSSPDRPRKERPFVQPVLGYWLIRRFPNVFARAIAEHV